MDWLGGLRRPPPPADEAGGEEGGGGTAVERASPGVAALFDGLSRDGGRVILDLGAASEAHLRLFRGYARKVRFAGLVPTPPRGQAWEEALDALPPPPEHPYDVVLAWNVLDLLEERERRSLVRRLEEVTAPGARLFVVADGSETAARPEVRFQLKDLRSVSQEVRGLRTSPGKQLLPAHMERLLEPFEVVRGFTLRDGLREYLAVKAG